VILRALGLTARDWVADTIYTWRRSSAGERGRLGARLVALPAILAVVVAVSASQLNRSDPQARVMPAASPSPSLDSPSPGPALTDAAAGTGAWRAADCSRVAAPPAMAAQEYPRVVIPSVGINVPIRPGTGGTPPEGQWVAWFFPGLNHPGDAGNTYVYAHAHGYPTGSASGLFWPLHYVHRCDPVYIYTAPTIALRYMVDVVDLHHSGTDTSVLAQTSDERLTLQTCNDWAPRGPKTIIVARRYVDPPPPQPPVTAVNPGPTRAPTGPASPGSGGTTGPAPGDPAANPSPGTIHRLLPSPG
jgi:LPXTG-site transpeptidase (sortase) family protein